MLISGALIIGGMSFLLIFADEDFTEFVLNYFFLLGKALDEGVW